MIFNFCHKSRQTHTEAKLCVRALFLDQSANGICQQDLNREQNKAKRVYILIQKLNSEVKILFVLFFNIFKAFKDFRELLVTIKLSILSKK